MEPTNNFAPQVPPQLPVVPPPQPVSPPVVPPPVVPPPPPAQSSFRLFWIILVVMILIGGVVCFYIWQKNRGIPVGEESNHSVETTPVIPQFETILEGSATSTTWQVYRDNKFGFEFEYPPRHIVRRSFDTIIEIVGPEPDSSLMLVMLGRAEGESYPPASSSTPFLDLAIGGAKSQCAADGGEGGQTDCIAVEKTTKIVNPAGFSGYEIYLTQSSMLPVPAEKTWGPVYALDFIPAGYPEIRGFFVDPDRYNPQKDLAFRIMSSFKVIK